MITKSKKMSKFELKFEIEAISNIKSIFEIMFELVPISNIKSKFEIRFEIEPISNILDLEYFSYRHTGELHLEHQVEVRDDVRDRAYLEHFGLRIFFLQAHRGTRTRTSSRSSR